MEREIRVSGECRHFVYKKKGDKCFGCGFCTIDGNDYSQMGQTPKPFD